MTFDLGRLRGLNKSNEFATAATDLGADIATNRQRLAELKAGMVSAPFVSTPDELKALRQVIRELEEDIETNEAILAEVSRRAEAAVASETESKWQARMAEAVRQRDGLREKYAAFDRAVESLCGIVEDIERTTASIQAANGGARAAGFEQLNVRVPGLAPELAKGLNEARATPLTQLRNASRSSVFDQMEANGKL